MNAFPMIERSAVRQWAALSWFEREEARLYQDAGVPTVTHRNLAHLWWVEVGARQDADYRVLPLMTVKEG